MFQDITKSYTGMDASLEIFAMLTGAFVLGFIFAWTMKSRVRYHHEEEHDRKKSYTNTKKKPFIKEQKDDLKKIEGIGPALEKILIKNNIESFHDLAQCSTQDLKDMLSTAGKKYTLHNPSSWPEQALMASQQRWGELTEFQDILGKKS